MNKSKAVLVIGNYRATLTVIRAFAARGFSVILGVEGDTHGNRKSRYVSELWSHPPLSASDDAFANAFMDFIRARDDIGCVFPVTESAVVYFAKRNFELPSGVVLASVDPETIGVCQSKEASMALAQRVGTPVAEYRVVAGLAALRDAATDVGFPCIVRPLVAPTRILGRKAIILESESDLHSFFASWPKEHASLIVQHYVQGPRHNIYFLASGGDLLCCIQVKILRTDRADGTGLAVEGITVATDHRLQDSCRALVRDLGYTGAGCAQYLVDPDSGEFCFIELNPRLGANCAIIQHCGLDLPFGMYLLAKGLDWEPAHILSPFRKDQRYAWLYGDIAGLWHESKSGALDFRARTKWLAKAIANSLRADMHLTFSIKDPAPSISMFARRLKPATSGQRSGGNPGTRSMSVADRAKGT